MKKRIEYTSPPMRCMVNKQRSKICCPKLTITPAGTIVSPGEGGEKLKAFNYMKPMLKRIRVIVDAGPGKGQRMASVNVEPLLVLNGLARYKKSIQPEPLY